MADPRPTAETRVPTATMNSRDIATWMGGWSWDVIVRTLLWQREGSSQPSATALPFASHRQMPSCDQEMAIGRTSAAARYFECDHGGVESIRYAWLFGTKA